MNPDQIGQLMERSVDLQEKSERHLKTMAEGLAAIAINLAEDAVIKRLPPELAAAFLHREARVSLAERDRLSREARAGAIEDLIERLAELGHETSDCDGEDDPVVVFAQWLTGKLPKESGQ